MKALRIEKPHNINLIEMEKPAPKKDEAILKIISAGICGSDIGALKGTNPLVSYPRTIGHEIVAEVISTPKNSKGIIKGDKVIVDPYIYCGECYPCKQGKTNCCSNLKVLGVHQDGGICEYFTIKPKWLIKLPDGIDLMNAPILEPLTIALHGVHRARLVAGEYIAIFGAGTIGLLAAIIALEYKAIPVIIDIIPERIDQAKKLGISCALNAKDPDFKKEILKITNDVGVQIVMEASGANSSILSSLDIVADTGRIVLTGWPSKETPFPTDKITKKELDILGARTSANEFQEAISLLSSGKIPTSKLITNRISLDESVNIIKNMEKKPSQYLKVIIDISGDKK